MRMWSVPPETMCQKHLLGEHVEIHALVSIINRGMSVDGYIRNNLLDASIIHTRHEQIVQEMLRRDMSHQTPLAPFNNPEYKLIGRGSINEQKSREDLHGRCAGCKKRYEEVTNSGK